MTRAAAIAVVCGALLGTPAASAAPQHQHGAPPDSAPVALRAVTTRAERVAVEMRSGATVVHTRGHAAAGGSIADLLRTVPGIELDSDGHISMRGSAGVLLLMDGRRTELSGATLLAFLRQMPAASLQRVEAGTMASARQGADGAAGVVNLVFHMNAARRVAPRSLAASVASDDHYMVSAAAAGESGEILDWDVTASLSGMRPVSHTTTARWSLVPGDLALHTEQESRGQESHYLRSIQGGAAVTPAPSVSLALRGGYSWMEGAYRHSSAFTFTNAAGDTDAGVTASLLGHVIPSGHVSAVARIGRGATRFTSEARASFTDEDFRGDYDDVIGNYRYMTTVMDSRQRERVLRNDLGLRTFGMDVDVGQESRLRSITTTHDLTHFNATTSQLYRYETDVHAGYLTAQRAIGAVSAEAGLRVEGEHTSISLGTDSERNAVRLFPSLGAEWTDARRALTYRLAYGRRINRPSAEMLNPFSMGGDDMNEIVGNPALLPEVSDQVEFGIERHRERLALQLTPFLRWTRDPIRQFKAATPSGGAVTTLVNLTRSRAFGADASVRTEPTTRAVVTLAGSMAHMETESPALNSSGVYATARLTLDVRVSERTTAQLYAYRRSAQAIEQGEILPAFTSELALTQRLAGDRGRVTLRLNDPLRSDRLEFRIADADFTQQSRRRAARPLLSLFASWAIGGAPREDESRTERPARIF